LEELMSGQSRVSNYIQLGLQTSLVYLSLNFLRGVLHEFGHGLAASLVGLRFIGVYGSVFSSSASFNIGERTMFSGTVTSLGGPLVDLAIGLIVLFVVLPRLKGWGARLFALLLASTTLLAFWGYMTSGALGSGDFGAIAALLGIPRLTFGVLGLLGLVAFLYLLAREIFRALAQYFPLDGFGKRFIALFLFLGLPPSVYVAGYLLTYPRYQMLGQFVLVVAILAALSALIKSSAHALRPLSMRVTATSTAGFVAACGVWLGVFGPTYERARGIVWGPVEETSVGYCNIRVQLNDDLTARIDVLARPVAQRMFWKELEERSPDWTLYTRFLERNLPVLLGIESYTLLSRRTEADASVYAGPVFGWVKGGRAITAAADLKGVLQPTTEGGYALELTDFWRIEGRGYIDRLEVAVPEGMTLTGYEVEPPDADEPDQVGERSVVWENADANRSPEKVRLTLSPMG
jgi:hypothetical protein